MATNEMSDIVSPKKSRFARKLILMLLMSLLSGGGWIAWTYILQPQPEDNLVVLRANSTPFKVKPATGTQADIPNQDSTFMNLIDGSADAEKSSEVISFPDPKPEPPPVAFIKPKDEKVQTARKSTPVSQGTDAQIQQPTQKADDSSAQLADKDAGATGDQVFAGGTQENIMRPKAEQTKPKAVDLTVALNTPAAPTPRPKLTKPAKDAMMVQLAAFRKQGKAKTAAALLNQKHAVRLQGYQLDVRSVKSTDGQLFWRVITDPLPKQDALSICEGLKRAGQDCIIRQVKAQQP